MLDGALSIVCVCKKCPTHSAYTNCQIQEVPGLRSSNIWKSWWSNIFTHFQKFNLNILKLSFM